MRLHANREILLSLVLALATVLCYAGVLANGFINLDDDLYVYNNPVVRTGLSRPSVNWAFSTTETANWHPLTWLSLELDYQLFGLNPAGYHATNLLLHVANTVALFWLLRQLTGAVGRSACVAAFFAVHPLHVESVAWISERKDVLSTLLLLLSLLFWQSYAKRAAVWAYAAAVILFILSLMAKAMGVTLPLLLCLLDVWPLRRLLNSEGPERRRQDNRPSRAAVLAAEKLPFFLIAAVFVAVAVLAQGRSGAMQYGNSLSLGDRLLNVPVNYATYLRQTVWPADLAILYPHPGRNLPLWKPVVAALGLGLITAVVWRLRKPCPYLLVGWFWFLLTLLPVIGVVQFGRQATADRYMYLPMIGLLIALCWSGYDLARERRWLKVVLSAACATALLLRAELTARQVLLWRDDITLWEHALAAAPPTTTSANNYGKALHERGEQEEAERWFRTALKIAPTDFHANFNLGVLLGKAGRYEEAVRRLRTALRAKPYDPLVLENLGLAEELLGRLDAAMEHYELAAQLNPRSLSIRQKLTRARQRRGG